MKHLVMVGACYQDTILTVPYFPQEDAKLRASSLSIRRGGNCPNSLEVLQQLVEDKDDTLLYLVSCLPQEKSPATRQIVTSFGPASKIRFENCLYREGHTEAASSYIIRSEKTGSRTLVNYNDLPEMTIQEFRKIVARFTPEQETWWHFEGRIPETTLACIEILRETLPAAHVSVEVEKPGREGLTDLAAEADVTFYSRSWAENRGHSSAKDCLMKEQRHGRSIGVCTWGADGAAAVINPQAEYIHAGVGGNKQGISVVDTVGAGDTFIGAMIYGLLCRTKDWDTAESLRFAASLATVKVQQEGFDGLGDLLTSFISQAPVA